MKLTTVEEPSANDRLIARLFVAAQFGLITALAVLPRRTDWPVPAGLRRAGNLAVAGGVGIVAVASTSLGRGLTAVPLPNDHAQLRTDGVYRLARHPIYTGVLIAATARAFLLGNRWAGGVTAALCLLLNGKARFEEQHLAARFPEYAEYADHTLRFIPATRLEHMIAALFAVVNNAIPTPIRANARTMTGGVGGDDQQAAGSQ